MEGTTGGNGGLKQPEEKKGFIIGIIEDFIQTGEQQVLMTDLMFEEIRNLVDKFDSLKEEFREVRKTLDNFIRLTNILKDVPNIEKLIDKLETPKGENT